MPRQLGSRATDYHASLQPWSSSGAMGAKWAVSVLQTHVLQFTQETISRSELTALRSLSASGVSIHRIGAVFGVLSESV
jgi:hypothetical protein